MGMPFPNPVVQGGTGSLVIPQIQSSDYVTGVSGWAIFQNGNVEFNSGTFRGTISAGTFQGTDFTINPSGAFFYSGTPAAGNLIASIAPAAGTDAQGNAYPAGITAYPLVGTDRYAIQLGNLTGPYAAVAALTFADQASAPNMPAALAAESNASGSAVTLESGQGTGAATAATLSLFDSAAGAQAGGLAEIAAGLVQVTGKMSVTGTINGVQLALATAPVNTAPVSGAPATPQSTANLYNWAGPVTANINDIRATVIAIIAAGAAAGIW